MYYKKGLFKNEETKRAIINNIKDDYLSGKPISEISEDYGFSKRQIKYIISYYIKINRREYKKELSRRRSMINADDVIVKIDDENYIVGDKRAKKCTLDDLIKKANKTKKGKRKSTIKKVENNK